MAEANAVVYNSSLNIKNSRKTVLDKLKIRYCFVVTLCLLLCNYINNVITIELSNNIGAEVSCQILVITKFIVQTL